MGGEAAADVSEHTAHPEEQQEPEAKTTQCKHSEYFSFGTGRRLSLAGPAEQWPVVFASRGAMGEAQVFALSFEAEVFGLSLEAEVFG